MNPYAMGGEYWWFVATLCFTFGITWGSFFNVCIYRVPVKKSVVKPGSHCYHCGTFLKWYDNIPLLSYLLLRGNCRSCGTHFSSRYFFIELLSGLMFLGLFFVFGFDWALPFHIVFASILLVGFFTDIDHFILPDGLTIGGFVVAVAAATILGKYAAIAEDYALMRDLYFSFFSPNRMGEAAIPGRLEAVLWSLVSAAFGYGMLWAVGWMGKLMFQKEAMGGGDVKLFAFLGAYMGALNCVWILFLSSFLGAVIGLTLIATHMLMRKDEFEDLVLAHASAVKLPWQTAIIQPASERQAGTVASLVEVDPEPISNESDASNNETSEAGTRDLVLKIARRTSRQMKHLPYGPYIAVAALVILAFQDWLNQATREYLMLPF